MKKFRRKVEATVRQKAHRDSAANHFVQFAFRFFSNEIVSGVATIIGTVVIALMVGMGYYKWGFWVISGVYCLAIICIGWANGYAKQKLQDITHFQTALRGMGSVLRAWAITLQRATVQFKKIDFEKEKRAVDCTIATMDFQSAAFLVCEKLQELLTRLGTLNDIYVTVYQRMKDECGTDYCKMIAYSQNHEPTGYTRKYTIPPAEEAIFGDIELHSYIFASGETDTIVLPNKEAVQKAFELHLGCEAREQNICQYIGIPIVPGGMGVTFLLQVDTSIPSFFGDSEEGMKEFSNNVINPFAQFLHMIYEQGRTVELLTK